VSRIVFNPFDGSFDQVRTTSIDVDSAGVIEAAVEREIDSATLPGGSIFNAIDSDFDIHLDAELTSTGKITLAIDSDAKVLIDSAALSNDGGYEFTGGFTDRDSGSTGANDIGSNVEYTTAMVSSSAWLRFGFDSARQLANDTPYWTDGAGGNTEAPGSGTTAYRGTGLFSGHYMPAGVTSLFDFNDSTAFNLADTSGELQYNAAGGSYDMSGLQTGDFCQFRFDFNATPQFANTTLEVGLIWQTRDAGGNPTFTFALTGEPIFFGSGTTGRTFLNRPIITAYLASLEDVNARALPAIRSDQPIFIQPLTTLFTVGR